MSSWENWATAQKYQGSFSDSLVLGSLQHTEGYDGKAAATVVVVSDDKDAAAAVADNNNNN